MAQTATSVNPQKLRKQIVPPKANQIRVIHVTVELLGEATNGIELVVTLIRRARREVGDELGPKVLERRL